MVAHAAVELIDAIEAGRRDPADDLGRGAQRVVGPAGIDALGREGEVDVLADAQAGRLEQGHQPLAGGARIGGRLEHDQLAGLEHLGQRLRRGVERPEVGLAVLVQRRRDADDDGVGLGQVGVAIGGPDPGQHRAQTFRRDVLDVGVAGGDGRDLQRIDVERDDIVAGLGERDRQRQPDVSEAYDPYFHAGLSLEVVAFSRQQDSGAGAVPQSDAAIAPTSDSTSSLSCGSATILHGPC